MNQAPVQLPRLEDGGSQAVRKNGVTARYNKASRLRMERRSATNTGENFTTSTIMSLCGRL